MPDDTPLRLAFVASQDPRVATNGVNSHSRGLRAALLALGQPVAVSLDPFDTAPGRRAMQAGRMVSRLTAGRDGRALSDLTRRYRVLADRARRTPALRTAQVVHAQDYVAAVAALDALGADCPPIVLAYHLNGTAGEELAARFALGPDARAVTWAQRASERAVAAARLVVAVSPWAAQVLASRLAVPADRLALVPNGVAVPDAPPDLAGRAPLVLGVGQLLARKGFDLLVEAMAGLRGPDGEPVPAVVLGDGPDRATLASLAEGRGGQVQFPGPVAEVGPWLARASLFALPSRAENLPMALLEAMAAGLPVVAADVGSVADALGRPGDADAGGILVPPDDAPALHAALGDLAADPARAAALGHKAWARARARYGREAMARAWLALYRRAAAPPAP